MLIVEKFSRFAQCNSCPGRLDNLNERVIEAAQRSQDLAIAEDGGKVVRPGLQHDLQLLQSFLLLAVLLQIHRTAEGAIQALFGSRALSRGADCQLALDSPYQESSIQEAGRACRDQSSADRFSGTDHHQGFRELSAALAAEA